MKMKCCPKVEMPDLREVISPEAASQTQCIFLYKMLNAIDSKIISFH